MSVSVGETFVPSYWDHSISVTHAQAAVDAEAALRMPPASNFVERLIVREFTSFFAARREKARYGFFRRQDET